MKPSISVFLLSALALLAVGCGSIVPITYAPNPARIANPADEVKGLILANTSPGCVAEPSFLNKMLSVKYVCARAIGNTVVRFDRVKRIHIQQFKTWYRVVVEHNDAPTFYWTSKSQTDIERLADAFTALTDAASKPAAAPGQQI